MKIASKTIGKMKILFPSGQIKGINSIKLSGTLERQKKSKYNTIIVDFRNVDFYDSSCFGSLIYAQVILNKHNKKLALYIPHNHLIKILQDFNFSEAFKLIESYE